MEATSTQAATPSRYSQTDTVARSTLVGRGWTVAHLKRLLGDPEVPATEGQPARYDRARVDAAERADQQLQQRLDRLRERRSVKQRREISRRVGDGQVVWRRREGRWVLFGQDLRKGQLVVATRRGGRTERKQITEVLEITPDGVYAEAGRVPAPRRPRNTAVRQVMLPGRHSPGAVVEVDGEHVELLLVRHVVITAEDPGRWGTHLTGYVGRAGTRATSRPVDQTRPGVPTGPRTSGGHQQ